MKEIGVEVEVKEVRRITMEKEKGREAVEIKVKG